MAVIVQIVGVKRWQLWRPMLPSPMRACVRACVPGIVNDFAQFLYRTAVSEQEYTT